MLNEAKYLVPILILVSGCQKTTTEYSDLMTEPGLVYDVAYIPAGHGSGSGVGFTTGGNMAVTSTTVRIPERYAVIFQCQHGKFVVNNQDAKELYHRLDVGDSVNIHYREVFEVVTEDEVEISRASVDLDFVDAKRVAIQ